MIKKTFILLLALTAFTSIKADIIEKTYYFTDYKITKQSNYNLISFKNTMLTGKQGEPVLPYQSVSLLLPSGQMAQSIEFITENETEIAGNFNLFPQQYNSPLSKGESGAFVKNENIYKSSQTYPNKIDGELTTQYMNGYSIAFAVFTPVKYIPSQGKITYYQKVTIRINTKTNETSNQVLKNINSSKNIINRLKLLVQNPELLTTYPSKTYYNNKYEMLIITKNSFIDNFSSLISLYQARGIKIRLKSVENINSTVSGIDSQDKIRNYIINQYQQNGIEYVLLGGDVEIVPYRGFYCHVHSASLYEDESIPADIYYSSLDGNWNNDNDNRWGEEGEDDLLPDVAVGRLSFSNNTELTAMLHKITSYQANPLTTELNKPFFAGEKLSDSPLTWGGNYLDLLIGLKSDNGYTTNGVTSTDNIEKLYDNPQTEWTQSTLLAKINSGKSYIHHVGHSNADFTMRFYTQDITNSNFSQVNGITHNYTNVYTHGCICGAFDADDCIAEKMVTIENFAVSFIGNSRYGWFNEGTTEGPSEHMHREYVNALYTDKISNIGETHMVSKIMTAPWVNAPGQWEEGALRWCFYDCNLLGDPAMSIWTKAPINMTVNYNDTLAIGTENFSLNVQLNNGIPYNYKAVLKNDSIEFGIGYSDSTGNITIHFDRPIINTGTANLIITGANMFPLSYSISIVQTNLPYIVINSYQTIDGNNNTPDYNDNMNLNLNFLNAGSIVGNNINASLSTNDSYINITDNTESLGNILPNTSLNITNAFGFTISDSVPDGHKAKLMINISDNSGNSWQSTINLSINAPKFEIINYSINDANGNNNKRIDAGETVTFKVNIKNFGHCKANNINCILGTTSTPISINSNSQIIDSIGANSFKTIDFQVTANSNINAGTIIDLISSVQSGFYKSNKIFYPIVGAIIEDFESNNFNTFNWIHGGNSNWTINNSTHQQGNYSAKSGIISNGQNSTLSVNINSYQNDSVSFFIKVSSEINYDFLKLYIDNTSIGSWSGEIGWTRISFPISAGNHIIKWSYEKDNYSSSGSDCAWLDNIMFPATQSAVNINESNILINNISFYPNPCNDLFNINLNINKKELIKIDLYNSYGRFLNTISSNLYESGNYNIIVNSNDLSSGIYFLIFEINNKKEFYKFIVTR